MGVDDPGEAAPLRRAVLPNGMNIAYQTKAELAQFYDDIFVREAYLRHGIELADGASVFDVGANIGLFTVFVAHRVRGARILAFEPAPPLFSILAENALWCEGEVLLFDCGLGERAGEAELTFYPQTSGMSSFHADAGEERAALRTLFHNQAAAGLPGMAEVLRSEEELLDQRLRSRTYTRPIRTLSSVVEELGVERIDLLKIDVEKSEAQVLAGIAERDWPRIRQIVAEVHDLGDRLASIAADLRARGFAVIVEQEELYRGSDRHNLYARREP
ncbi:MAG TPA: FkbM family methyltransferase [Thermoanaerobaculia bacterium]